MFTATLFSTAAATRLDNIPSPDLSGYDFVRSSFSFTPDPVTPTIAAARFLLLRPNTKGQINWIARVPAQNAVTSRSPKLRLTDVSPRAHGGARSPPSSYNHVFLVEAKTIEKVHFDPVF